MLGHFIAVTLGEVRLPVNLAPDFVLIVPAGFASSGADFYFLRLTDQLSHGHWIPPTRCPNMLDFDPVG